jgi:hypothetical protein
MPRLFGEEVTREGILSRVGDVRQVAGARPVELADGPARGARAVEVWTGSGLRFTLVADRCLDIADASFKGMPLAWLSAVGVTGPAFCEERELRWLRSFGGGLLTTCGLQNVGRPSEDEGELLGLHGRISHQPARDLSISQDWRDGKYVISISAVMREAVLFGENLELRRTIETGLGSKSISVRDRVTNLGAGTRPFMILYHVNIGWPVVSEHSEIVASDCRDEPHDELSASEAELSRALAPPEAGYRERIYHRDLPADAEGIARIAVVNRKLAAPLGVAVAYGKEELPNVAQWKNMGRGEYVVGLEPTNCGVVGRSEERARGTLRSIEPGEVREVEVAIGVLDSEAAIDAFASSLPGVKSGASGAGRKQPG